MVFGVRQEPVGQDICQDDAGDRGESPDSWIIWLMPQECSVS